MVLFTDCLRLHDSKRAFNLWLSVQGTSTKKIQLSAIQFQARFLKIHCIFDWFLDFDVMKALAKFCGSLYGSFCHYMVKKKYKKNLFLIM